MKKKKDVTCPLCRSAVADPQFFLQTRSSNSAVSALAGRGRILIHKHVCCAHNGMETATLCLCCSSNYCRTCSEVHRNMFTLDGLESQTGGNHPANRRTPCGTFSDGVPEIRCVPHGVFICKRSVVSSRCACLGVTSLNDALGSYKQSLLNVGIELRAKESDTNRMIQTLDKYEQMPDKSANSAVEKIDVACNSLADSQQSHKEQLKRTKETADDTCDDIFQMHNVTLSHKRRMVTFLRLLIKCIMLPADDRLLVAVMPRLNIGIRDRNSLMPLETKLLLLATSFVEQVSITTYKRIANGHTVDEQPNLQTWQFHKNHGQNVALSNDRRTAELKKSFYGIVMSNEPLKTRTLYEMLVEEEDTWFDEKYFIIGVIVQSPSTLTLPKLASFHQSTISIRTDHVGINQQWIKSNYGHALNTVKVGSRIGVVIDAAQNFHLYVDGKDQGVVYCDVKQPCHAIFDFCWGCLKKVSCLPVTSVP